MVEEPKSSQKSAALVACSVLFLTALLVRSTICAGGEKQITELLSCSGAALGQSACKLFDLTPHEGQIRTIGCGHTAATTVTHNGLTLLSLEQTDGIPLDAKQDGTPNLYARYATSSEPDAVRELVQSRNDINRAISTMEARQEQQDHFAVDADVRLCPPADAICTSLLLLCGTWAN